MLADDVGDLFFEGGLGIGEDAGFFNGFARILQQGVKSLLALLGRNFIPDAVLVMDDFDMRLLDGMNASGRQGDADRLSVWRDIDGDGLIEIEAGFRGEATFQLMAFGAAEPSALDRMGVLEVFFDRGKLRDVGAGLGDGMSVDGDSGADVENIVDIFENTSTDFFRFVFRVSDDVNGALVKQHISGSGECCDDKNDRDGSGDGAGVGLHGLC